MSRSVVSCVLAVIGAFVGFQGEGFAQTGAQAPSASLTVNVIKGRDAANILKPPSVVPPTVDVRDANNRPIIGAVVTFTSPTDEPTVKFPNGNRSYSVVTDLAGRATVEDMVPMGLGTFHIEVAATLADSNGSARISETNYPTLKAATGVASISDANRVKVPTEHGLSTGAKVGIIAAVGVAIGVGVFFAERGHKTSSSVSAGTPTVGAP